MLDMDGFVDQGGLGATSRIRCALYYPLGGGVLWVFMPIGGVSLAELSVMEPGRSPDGALPNGEHKGVTTVRCAGRTLRQNQVIGSGQLNTRIVKEMVRI